MNAIMERWVRTCGSELLDRSLIWNQRHLLHALPESDPDQLARLNIHRRDRLNGVLHEYEHAA